MKIDGLNPSYQKILDDLEKLVEDGIAISNSSSLLALAKLPGLLQDIKILMDDLRKMVFPE